MTTRPNPPLFLGIDAGTTSLKAALFDLQGRQLAVDRQEYTLLTPAPSVVELDAEVYWQACCKAVRNAIAISSVDARQVAALSISSQGETLIAVDEAGTPTRKAIVWLDNRAVEEAELIGREFDRETVYHTTGQPEVAPTWPACKILWIRRREPAVFARSVRFLLLEDYLLHRLTGEAVTEYSLQTSSLMLDIREKRWWADMLDFVGISQDRLPRLLEPGQPVARLTPQAAAATGLTERTIAVCGGLDQTVGAVGAGNIAPGVVTETTGGALAVLVTLDRPQYDPQHRVPCHYHARRDTYCLLPWGQTAGMALRWFRDRFFQQEAIAARDAGLDPFDLMVGLAHDVPPGSDGLVMLPHLEGAACPEFNAAAKGVFYGATLQHTRGHFVRAILESVAYMLKKNLDIVEDLGVSVSEIRSLGGASRSPLWLRIKADVLQKPFRKVQVDEAACLGAAILAAVATDHHASLEDAVLQMVELAGTVEPSDEHLTAYQQGYALYLELYERLAPMFR